MDWKSILQLSIVQPNNSSSRSRHIQYSICTGVGVVYSHTKLPCIHVARPIRIQRAAQPHDIIRCNWNFSRELIEPGQVAGNSGGNLPSRNDAVVLQVSPVVPLSLYLLPPHTRVPTNTKKELRRIVRVLCSSHRSARDRWQEETCWSILLFCCFHLCCSRRIGRVLATSNWATGSFVALVERFCVVLWRCTIAATIHFSHRF